MRIQRSEKSPPLRVDRKLCASKYTTIYDFKKSVREGVCDFNELTKEINEIWESSVGASATYYKFSNE